MLHDVCFIFITAFAFFGLYCFIDAFIMSARNLHSPCTITIMRYTGEKDMYNAISYIHNTLYNNEIILVTEDDGVQCPFATTVTGEELHKYITIALFTKN